MSDRSAGNPWLKARLETETFDLEYWRKLAVGDLGGIVLERPGLSDEDQNAVNDTNDRCLGLNLKDLQRCARKAWTSRSEDGPPGVIVVAHSAEKAPVLAEAVRRGCVSEMIVDEELAEALCTEFGEPNIENNP